MLFRSLDEITRERLNDELLNLFQTVRFAGLFITHSIQEAVFLSTRVLVMSARPGRIIEERKIDLPRPRDLEVTFTPAFTDIVHELRAHIVRARQ